MVASKVTRGAAPGLSKGEPCALRVIRLKLPQFRIEHTPTVARKKVSTCLRQLSVAKTLLQYWRGELWAPEVVDVVAEVPVLGLASIKVSLLASISVSSSPSGHETPSGDLWSTDVRDAEGESARPE